MKNFSLRSWFLGGDKMRTELICHECINPPVIFWVGRTFIDLIPLDDILSARDEHVCRD